MTPLYVIAKRTDSKNWLVSTYKSYDAAKIMLEWLEATPTPEEIENNPTFFYEPMSREYFDQLAHPNFFAILKIEKLTEQEEAKIRVKCKRALRKFLGEHGHEIIIKRPHPRDYNQQFIQKTKKLLSQLKKEGVDISDALSQLETLIKFN